MAHNFQIFDPNCTNMESDSLYTADAQRSGGAALNAIFASSLANKLFYQCSIGVTGLMQMLSNKGYSPNDGNASPGTALTNLSNVLANIMTQADMAPYALLNSPTFIGTPKAPTPPTNDNSTRLATTAFVRQAVVNLFGFSRPSIQLPSSVSIGANNPTNVLSLTVTFPTIGGANFIADIRWAAFCTVGANVVTGYILETTNNLKYAPAGQNSNGVGYTCLSGSQLSTGGYSSGSVVTFDLIITANAGITVTRDSPLLPNGGAFTFIAITPIQVL